MIQHILVKNKTLPQVVTLSPEATMDDKSFLLALQLDVALMTLGFKLSHQVIDYLSKIPLVIAHQMYFLVLSSLREMLGDHVEHNVYFKNFPKNVPLTEEFWQDCLSKSLKKKPDEQLVLDKFTTLLMLPTYGTYQHSYQEMLSKREDLVIDFIKLNNLKVIHLGKTLEEETTLFYHQLAQSRIPLNPRDQVLLEQLAKHHLESPIPSDIKIRENKAIINAVRLINSKNISADTPTDILRLACALSGGDVTLGTKTKFKSFKRAYRKTMMESLHLMIQSTNDDFKFDEIGKYRERWKRLSEFLHPHEFKDLTNARKVFAVARKDVDHASYMGTIESCFKTNALIPAMNMLGWKPGYLFRNIDRILRSISSSEEFEILKTKVKLSLPKVSGRVILSVIEHLQNREIVTVGENTRVFPNSKNTVWVSKVQQKKINLKYSQELREILTKEIQSRLKLDLTEFHVTPEMETLTVPLSEKNKPTGAFILPRGSVNHLGNPEILRFFMYWKQTSVQTDYDLSCLIFDENFQYMQQCSWTHLLSTGMTHSGDIRNAPEGASEFIDVNLSKIKGSYIIPSINFYAGETYDQCEEAFFGYMERTEEQKGKPFEPFTVKMKSDIQGKGKVYLPLCFKRTKDGWDVKWLHMFLNGLLFGNKVEQNLKDTSHLIKAVMNREYLQLKDLLTTTEKSSPNTTKSLHSYLGMTVPVSEEVIYTKIYTLDNLSEIIPA